MYHQLKLNHIKEIKFNVKKNFGDFKNGMIKLKRWALCIKYYMKM